MTNDTLSKIKNAFAEEAAGEYDVDSIQVDLEEAIAAHLFHDERFTVDEYDAREQGQAILKLVVDQLSPEGFVALKLAYGGQA